MNRVVFNLWALLNSENSKSTQYLIAKTLLDNIFELEHTSIDSMAKLCNVSKASISRFVKELGYADYFAFRSDLQATSQNTDNIEDYEKVDSHHQLEKYISNCQRELDHLNENVKEIELNQLARAIVHHDRVILAGDLQAGCVAQILQMNLFCAGKMTQLVLGKTFLRDMGEELNGEELLIVFSSSGQGISEDIISTMNAHTEIYLITTNPKIEATSRIHVINTRTGFDLAAGNISMNVVANMLYLKAAMYLKQ